MQLLLVLAILGACVWLAFASRLRNVMELGAGQLGLSIYLLALPMMYAFGTNRNYVSQANMAGLFWILGSLLFVSTLLRTGGHRWFVSAARCFVAASSLGVVLIAAESPTRQDVPLRVANERVQLGVDRATVYVSDSSAQLVRMVQDATRGAGFTPGHHTIDFTGTSPGIPFSFGSRGVGLAWLLGGAPGTSAVVLQAFRHVSCAELATAWVLSAESGSRSVDVALLRSFAADLGTGYTAVAQWPGPFEGEIQVFIDRREAQRKLLQPVLRHELRARHQPLERRA